jgi:hypothetical protein
MIKPTKNGDVLNRPNILRKFSTIDALLRLKELDYFNKDEKLFSS